MLRYSLNEIEASSRKAARGAGMAWGLAEEAGKATRWLAARGLPSVPVLLALLKENDGKAYDALRPESLGETWQSSGGTLCPVIAGSALNDLAERLADGETITLSKVTGPALVLPILGRAAKYLQRGFEVTWGKNGGAVRVLILPDSLYLDAASADSLAVSHALDLRVSGLAPARAVPTGIEITRRVRGIPLDNNDWSDLQAFAARTYVPASEESRLRGAGAGVTDED